MLYSFLFVLNIFLTVTQIFGNDSQLKDLLSQDTAKIERYENEEFTYDSYGFLNLNGKWKNVKARPTIIFFKNLPDNICTNSGVYFDMVVCIPCNSSCKEGIKICYESEMAAKQLKEPGKYALNKLHNKVNCRNDNLHGLQINAEYNKATKAVDVTIISSIDDNSYKFPIPPPLKRIKDCCFKIRVGNKETLATEITDLNDAKLNVIPELKTINKNENWLDNGWGQSRTNFHLFSLDFIPMKDKRLIGIGDFYKKFSYFGSGDKCPMYIKIAGNRVLKCERKWIKLDDRLSCKHGGDDNKRFKNLREKRVGGKCPITFEETDLKKINKFTRNTDKTGTWNTSDSYVNYQEGKLSISISVPIGGGFSVPQELINQLQYIKKTEHKKEESTNEHVIESSIMRATTISSYYELSALPGEYMEIQVLTYDCNGWIYKTNYLRTYFDEPSP